MSYGKCPKISNTIPYYFGLNFAFYTPVAGMAKGVDPDQTAPAPSGAVWSGSALFAYVILSDTFLRKFNILIFKFLTLSVK